MAGWFLLFWMFAMDRESVPNTSNKSEGLAFRTLTTAHGLAQNNVKAILQDRDGFLWFGTESGLNRYDGYQFTTFRDEPFNPQSLSDSYITHLFQCSKGFLWVGARGGLSQLDPRTGKCVRFKHHPDDDKSLSANHVKSISEDAEGRLWIATWGGGLNRLDPQSGRITHIHTSSDDASLAGDFIRTVLVDRQGLVWVGHSREGIQRYNPKTGTWRHWRHNPQNKQGLGGNQINVIMEDHLGQIWVGIRRGGLARYLPHQDDFERVTLNKSPRFTGIENVNALHQGRDGSIWVGSWGAGIYRLNIMGSVLQHYPPDRRDSSSLQNGWINAIYEDHSRVLWAGLAGLGLYKAENLPPKFKAFPYKPNTNSISASNVAAVEEDRDGYVWLGLIQGGLNRYDPSKDRFTHYPPLYSNGSLNHPDVFCLLEDPHPEKRMIWMGTGTGLSRFNRDTGYFKNWKDIARDKNNDFPSQVKALAIDGQGRLVIGFSRAGVGLMDRETEEFTRLPYGEDGGLNDWVVFDVTAGAGGYIWIGTESGGLNRLDPEKLKFVNWRNDEDDHRTISHNRVKVIHQTEGDPDGLWLGTAGGLNYFDKKSGTAHMYATSNSNLSNNEVNGILEDDYGHLWVATNRGLNKFTPKTGRFRTYHVSDGLTDTDWNTGAFKRLRNGRLLFGGSNGLNAFYPNNILDNPHPPRMGMTGVRLHSGSLNPGDLPRWEDSETHLLSLSHQNNDITLDFVAMHYTDPSQNLHAFRLKGLSDEWTSSYMRTAHYTNLEPGDYLFEIKGANKDGVTSKVATPLKIVIKPPWWKTPLAYVAYVLFGLAGVFAVSHLEKKRLLAGQRRANQMERSRLRAETAEARAQAMEAEYKRGQLERRMLEEENDRKSRELNHARQLQMSLLPKNMPVLADYEVAVHMETATEVGGDYYDFHEKDGVLNMVVGDAAGHGLQAGNLVIATKSLFNTMDGADQLGEFMGSASGAIKNMGFKKMFMALMLARFKDRRLSLASAGMPYALLFDGVQGKARELILKGLPLGAPYIQPHPVLDMDLHSGDMLLMMSDGLPELFNGNLEMVGSKRVLAWFEELAQGSAQQVIAGLNDRAVDWADGRPADDDITLLAVKVL